MQITIDSNEPLSKVTALIGAVYGVDLVVDGSGAAPAASNGRGRGSARKATKAAKATRATKATRRGATGGRRAGRGSGGADPAAVRQWAIAQGLTVSSRGQLPKTVLEAYRQQSS